jgi:hypothetical protein
MAVSHLTYVELAERLKITPEAVRALVKRRRWPRKVGKDGKTRVSVDLAKIRHQRLPGRVTSFRAQITTLKGRIADLQAQLADMRSQRDHWQGVAERLSGALTPGPDTV